MTDKQIIIDGIDVSRCERHCSDNYNNPNMCYSDMTETYSNCNPKETQCNFYITSIEKQLKRAEAQCEDMFVRHTDLEMKYKAKEQSEEKLVKQLQTICDFINNRPETFKGVNGSVDKIITDYAKAKEQECETLASQLDFEVQKKECLEKKCKQQSWDIGNLGYKIKNQRHEINNRLKQLDQLKQECKELRVENKKLKEELLDLKLQFEEEQLMYEI